MEKPPKTKIAHAGPKDDPVMTSPPANAAVASARPRAKTVIGSTERPTFAHGAGRVSAEF
jgi:hypothetical protein